MLPDRMTKLLTAYVDGELTSRQRRTVLRLLQRSPEARRLFKRLKGDSMILRGLPKRKLQMDLSGSVLLTISTRNIQLRPEACPPIPKRITRPWQKWLALVALTVTVLVGVAVGSYHFFANLKPTDTKTVETPTARITTSQLPEENSPIAVVHDVDPMLTTPPPTAPDRPKRGPAELAGILVPKPQAYQVAAPRLVRILPLRELDQPIPRHQLQQDLQSANNFRLDLWALDTPQALERLQAGLKAKGVSLRIDSPAQANLAKRQKLIYAIYSEELSASDLHQLLIQLAAEERTKPIFDRLVVNALTPVDVAKVLGGEASQYPPPPERQGPLGVDITKPLEESTANQILKNLQGKPRSSGDPPAASPVDRQALAVIYNPAQAAALSRDVKAFLDNRRATYREGAIQVLIVLWNQ